MSGRLILSLQHVGLSYRRRAGLLRRSRFWALKDVSFDLHDGETLGVIGRNGAGKTTLLRLLAGIIEPDRGQLLFHHPCRTSLLSLQAGFLKELSGRENAVLSGLFLGLTHRQIESKLPEIIDFSELGDSIDQPVYTYSTGMKARLGFSVAFQADPDILLLDEVFGVGDVSFRAKSVAFMKERISSQKTVVLVSHFPQVIEDLCDRAVWIEGGRSQLAGPVPEVLRAYQESTPAPKAPAGAGRP